MKSRFKDARERLYLTVAAASTEPAELFSSFVTFFWGFQLLLPYDTFSVSPAWALFVASNIPEWFFGIASMSLGFSALASMLFNLKRVRVVSQYLCLGWWVAMATMIVLVSPTLPGIVFYISQAAARLWIALRLLNILQRPTIPTSDKHNASS